MNDTEQFISSLVNSLAWPGAGITIAIIFRRPLSRILRSRALKTLKAGPQGLEFDFFDETVKDAKSELAGSDKTQISPASPTLENAKSESGDFVAEMRRLADISPSAAVQESFSRLERLLRETVQEVEGEGRRSTRIPTVRGLARSAVQQGIISPSELAAFDDVAVLRNVVTHQGTDDLDKERAMEYVNLIRQLLIAVSLGSERTVLDGPVGKELPN